MFSKIARELIEIGGRFYTRGWVLGTSGNLSAVVSRQPLRLAITASAVHKGKLHLSQIVQIDASGEVVPKRAAGSARGAPRASAETLLHLEIVRRRGAGAVLHTHSVWSTILSDLHERERGLAIDG